MPSCVVDGCITRRKRDPNKSLHIFPKEPERIKLWLYQTGQYGADLDDMVIKVYLGKVNDTYRMCSLHFTQDSYNYNGYRRILKRDAIPTIFTKNKSSTSRSAGLISTTVPMLSGPSSSSSQQVVSCAPASESQKLSTLLSLPLVPTNFSILAGPTGYSLQQLTPSVSLSEPSTTSSCPVISTTSSLVSSASKTMTVVCEPKTYSKVSSVTQTPATTSGSAQKPPSVSFADIQLNTSQTVVPDSHPPSKKRKLEENENNSKLQKPSMIRRPLMVDKAVNTDHVTNRRSRCHATGSMYRRRNAQTQTKIYRKHRKIMCTLLVPGDTNDDSDSTVSLASPEHMGFSDCSDNDEPCDLKSHNLELVDKASEVDDSVPIFSHSIKAISVKEENAVLIPISFKSTSTIPNSDLSTLKIEPHIKLEGDPFSNSTMNVTQSPKTERTSPIPSEPLSPECRNPTLRETSAIKTDELEDLDDTSFLINDISEDEDESFLVPSDAEDEDDVKRFFQDLDSPVETPVEEEKYIVFESCLRKLIMMIPCVSGIKCMSPLTQYRKETNGSYLSIEVRCSSGHTSFLWESQPRHGYEPLGNILLSAAVLLSGSSFLKSQHLFKLLNMKSIDKTTYYKNQSSYLFPSIDQHWKEEQKSVVESVQGRPLCLAGDQQLDNPGLSAKYSIYSLMDVASKKICSLSVEPVTPQVTLEGIEKIGFLKTMGELQTMNADVKRIVTDRSVAIEEILKDDYPHVVHQLDLWHLSKSIGNEVLMAAKHKECEILYQWVEAIKKHMWWSSCTCCKNPNLLVEKWKSVIYHVANIHSWESESDCQACHHPPLPQAVVNNTNWLVKGSAAHEQLRKIVENPILLKDLKHLSFLCHMGELEIYRSTCLKYRPKTLHCSTDSMIARTQLAALDHNKNVHKVKAVVKNATSGEALDATNRRSEVYKGQKSWITKKLYEPACQSFLLDIMNDVMELVKEKTL